MLFVVGRSSQVDEEAATHGDLLQIDIDETYRNLVYKVSIYMRLKTLNASRLVQSCLWSACTRSHADLLMCVCVWTFERDVRELKFAQ